MKYYYNDPLSAAYMNKHFNMRFEKHAIGYDGKIEIYTVGYGGLLIEAHSNSSLRSYIESNSIELLKPQIGDFASYNGGGEQVCKIVRLIKEIPATWKVIYRDGKSFIWPEVE